MFVYSFNNPVSYYTAKDTFINISPPSPSLHSSLTLPPPPTLPHSSLIEFFKKIKKWLEMAKSPPSLNTKVESLERKFEVASIIFEKYSRVFADLFRKPDEHQAPSLRQRGRKAKQ